VDKVISLRCLVNALAAQIDGIAVTVVHALDAEKPYVRDMAFTGRAVAITRDI
jgi:hypothetical protein